jgi:hypothetical protein
MEHPRRARDEQGATALHAAPIQRATAAEVGEVEPVADAQLVVCVRRDHPGLRSSRRTNQAAISVTIRNGNTA